MNTCLWAMKPENRRIFLRPGSAGGEVRASTYAVCFPLFQVRARACCCSAAPAPARPLHCGGNVGISNSTHVGTTIAATDIPEKAEKLNRISTTNPGANTSHHADAKRELAPGVARRQGVQILESSEPFATVQG